MVRSVHAHLIQPFLAPDNMLKRNVLLLLFACATPSLAQESAGKARTITPAVSARLLWEGVRDYISQAAADFPESKYDFRPTPEVRTFGQLIAHVAGAQEMFCSIALGDKPRDEGAVEKTAKTKAELLAALRRSNEYCARAYGQSEDRGAVVVDLFGDKRPVLFVLLENATHDNEHYGNVVTYMRINGMIPPSSKPRPGG
jgi:uncharacterized damage-inducible protein DinB